MKVMNFNIQTHYLLHKIINNQLNALHRQYFTTVNSLLIELGCNEMTAYIEVSIFP